MCGYSRGGRVMRSDYRVNSGSKNAGGQTGPVLVQDPETYPWNLQSSGRQNGICSQRSAVRVAPITDGTAKTAMIGEKYLSPEHYFDGEEGDDDQCVYTGHDRDNAGYTSDGNDVFRPLFDEPTSLTLHYRFGSAHAVGINMAFCDGSVHQIGYDIDDDVWIKYGGRNDQERR